MKFTNFYANSTVCSLELQKPDSSTVAITNNKLNIDVKGGATIWYKPQLKGNIEIEYKATIVLFTVNDDTWFEHQDTSPYSSGNFAFRTLSNHMLIDDFKVFQLKELD